MFRSAQVVLAAVCLAGAGCSRLPKPNPDALLTLQWKEQAPFAADCRTRATGTVCLGFTDGYLWIVADVVRSWDAVRPR